MARLDLILFATIFGLLGNVMSLTCYENDSEKGTHEVTNPEWSYCGFIPSDDLSESRVFGIGPNEDSIVPYDVSFQQTDEVYKVLTMCLYEKYDMTRFSQRFKSVEYLFRCVCNYDLCNAPANFPQYLKKQRDSNL